MSIIIYTPRITPRIQYAWEIILRHVLQAEYTLCSDLAAYRNADGCKINYSTERQDAREVFIPAGNLLFASGIRPQDTTVFYLETRPAFFQCNVPDADIPFDMPAAIFYLVTRYEEYLPFEPDPHDRFPAAASLAHQNGFLQIPIVNYWCLDFYDLVKKYYPQIEVGKSRYQFRPTYDIDLAWAYRHKGFARTIGAGLRHLLRADFTSLQHQFHTLFGKKADPFDSYDYLENLHQQFNLHPIYFFLLGDYAPFDKNIHHRQPALRRLIRRLDQQNETGIHPSYRSHQQPERIGMERQRLEDMTAHPIAHSRQHFLRLRFPHTCRALLNAGIRHDYTLGYADAIGFRAGIATPFPWYDLEAETTTKLMMHPFQVMDVALKTYLKLPPEAAVLAVRNLIEQTKAVGGTFSTIWHNSSLSHLDGWQAWRPVYETILQMATKTPE